MVEKKQAVGRQSGPEESQRAVQISTCRVDRWSVSLFKRGSCFALSLELWQSVVQQQARLCRFVKRPPRKHFRGGNLAVRGTPTLK